MRLILLAAFAASISCGAAWGKTVTNTVVRGSTQEDILRGPEGSQSLFFFDILVNGEPALNVPTTAIGYDVRTWLPPALEVIEHDTADILGRVRSLEVDELHGNPQNQNGGIFGGGGLYMSGVGDPFAAYDSSAGGTNPDFFLELQLSMALDPLGQIFMLPGIRFPESTQWLDNITLPLEFNQEATAEVLARGVDGRQSWLLSVDGPYNDQDVTLFSGLVGGQHFNVTLDGYGWHEREIVFYGRRIRDRSRQGSGAFAAGVPEPSTMAGVIACAICLLAWSSWQSAARKRSRPRMI